MKYSKFIINLIRRVIRIEYERPPQLYKNILIDASGYLANGVIGILAGISFIYYYYANGAPASLRDTSFFVQPFGHLSMLFSVSATNILYFFLNMFLSLNGEGKGRQMYRLHRYLAKKGDDAFTLIESKHSPMRTGVEDREEPRRDSASGAARDVSGHTLLVEMTSKLVERKGPVLEPLKINGEYLEYILNTGVLALDHKRFLFARITQTRPVRGAETKRSEIGLYIHNDRTGETIAIDKKMLVPDGLKNVIALEDPRVIERDGTIFVYLTVVRKNGSYYSAVMTHDTKRFLDIVEKKQKNVEISWEWTPPLRLITDGPAAKENIKNFVPFGNPSVEDGKEYWYALYRPDTLERSTIRLARSEGGLAGSWKDAGLFMTVDPEKGWLGSSTYIPGMPEIPGSTQLEFMLIHYGAGGEGEGVNGYKYYDLRLMVADRNDPKKNYVIPLMAPKLGEAYEGETDKEKVWVPGTIYSCGAVLKEYDMKSGNYVLDIYYSGSDTAVLLATVTLNIKVKKGDGPKGATPQRRSSASGEAQKALPAPKESAPMLPASPRTPVDHIKDLPAEIYKDAAEINNALRLKLRRMPKSGKVRFGIGKAKWLVIKGLPQGALFGTYASEILLRNRTNNRWLW
ncbi:MAG: hypothetical protein Q8R48_06210, partial [Candidatus Omnitrophota bacterium]|nr:hypothetical protein [Candidatus Omnitrophota bacterium]